MVEMVALTPGPVDFFFMRETTMMCCPDFLPVKLSGKSHQATALAAQQNQNKKKSILIICNKFLSKVHHHEEFTKALYRLVSINTQSFILY
jgi:hypothetical protein